VNELTKPALPKRPDIHVETEGEFAGWRTWTRDNFETHNGPFWHRIDENGEVQCVFRVEKKHINGSGNVHGGAFMSFADYCLFAMAPSLLQASGVTVSFACEFLDAAREGELVEGRGENHPRRRFADFPARNAEIRRAHAVHLFRNHQAGEAEAADGRCRHCHLAVHSPGGAGATMRCCWRWRAAGVRPIR